jgi:ABC-type transporter Mla subunit MlaD
LLLLAATGGFIVFYIWFFWLRRRNGPPTLPMTQSSVGAVGAGAKSPEQPRATFGRR